MAPGAPFRFVRLAETERRVIHLTVDGEPCAALEGDTLLVALMTNGNRARQSEFGPNARAGFCLMAACQDCWLWTAEGTRLRACDTPVQDGLSILTHEPGASWLHGGEHG